MHETPQYPPRLSADIQRYGGGSGKGMPLFQRFWRKYHDSRFPPLKIVYALLFCIFRRINLCDFPLNVSIGPGLYLGHPYCIVINPDAVIGSKVNIAKGVTIGQSNRGKHKGCPIIGNNVWIGTNAVIVGKIAIGDDVLIAPNTLVNVDIPSHSVVYGNPCIIKANPHATYGYI